MLGNLQELRKSLESLEVEAKDPKEQFERTYGRFPKIRGTLLGVLIIGTLLFKVLYLDLLFSKLPYPLKKTVFRGLRPLTISWTHGELFWENSQDKSSSNSSSAPQPSGTPDTPKRKMRSRTQRKLPGPLFDTWTCSYFAQS